MSDKIIFIGEVGQNHGGNLGVAKWLISELIKAGADYVKFQLYDTSRLFDGTEPFYEPTCQAELTKSQAEYLAMYCKELGGQILFSAFDDTRVSWMIEILGKYYPEMDHYPVKIASRSAHSKEVYQAFEMFKTTGKFKPMKAFISHGMRSYDKAKWGKVLDTCYHLYCKSEYPCEYSPEDWLDIASKLASGEIQGISDHSIGTSAIKRAIDLGARVVEKHITYLDAPEARFEVFKAKGGDATTFRDNPPRKPRADFSFDDWVYYDQKTAGPDHVLSIKPAELKEIIDSHK